MRQFTYNEDGTRCESGSTADRLIPRGGNWGFSEFLLCYRAREYDEAKRYQRDMGFNMIRNTSSLTSVRPPCDMPAQSRF